MSDVKESSGGTDETRSPTSIGSQGMHSPTDSEKLPKIERTPAFSVMNELTSVIPVAPDDDGNDDTHEKNRLFVSNFPFSWREADMLSFFEEFKPIEALEIVYNERGSKGFGFVTIIDHERCERARNALNHSVVLGRRIEVRRAHKHKKHTNMGIESHRVTKRETSETRTSLVAQMIQQQHQRSLLESSAVYNQLQMAMLQNDHGALSSHHQTILQLQQQASLAGINPMLLNLLLANPLSASATNNVLIPPASPNPLLGGLPMYLPNLAHLQNVSQNQFVHPSSHQQSKNMDSGFGFQQNDFASHGGGMTMGRMGQSGRSIGIDYGNSGSGEIPSVYDRNPHGDNLLGIGSQLGYGPISSINQPSVFGHPSNDFTGIPVQKGTTASLVANNLQRLSNGGSMHGQVSTNSQMGHHTSSSLNQCGLVSDVDGLQYFIGPVNTIKTSESTGLGHLWGNVDSNQSLLESGRKRTADSNFSQHDHTKMLRR